jgi:hypothetical protein
MIYHVCPILLADFITLFVSIPQAIYISANKVCHSRESENLEELRVVLK